VRGGYIHGFAVKPWMEDNGRTEIQDGPDADFRGGCALLTVGAGRLNL
jgi:hypothetical protein